MRRLASLVLTTAVAVTSVRSTSSFIPSAFPAGRAQQRQTVVVEAKSKARTKASGGGGFGGGGGGGGFAASGPKKGQKSRSISGHTTGAGTKPLRIAANTFDAIRKKYGPPCTSDVYVRAPLNDKDLCWFVGKVARRMELDDPDFIGSSIPTEQEAVISQKRLILEYAKNQLRPQNLGGPYAANLELWLAPGDSEMDAVQNKVSFVKVVGSTADISNTFSVDDVGYNPEIYVGDEIKDGGLRVVRDADGKPVKPVFEINQ